MQIRCPLHYRGRLVSRWFCLSRDRRAQLVQVKFCRAEPWSQCSPHRCCKLPGLAAVHAIVSPTRNTGQSYGTLALPAVCKLPQRTVLLHIGGGHLLNMLIRILDRSFPFLLQTLAQDICWNLMSHVFSRFVFLPLAGERIFSPGDRQSIGVAPTVYSDNNK